LEGIAAVDAHDGARYDAQTNMRDHNNLGPRLGFAYALGPATVIRGGGGMFHLGMPIAAVEDQRRLDGARQLKSLSTTLLTRIHFN